LPKVTVLMPVYNNAIYLHESVSSILNQTYADFELLIIDDGSTDDSLAVIESFQDPRIRLVASGVNEGLVAALNKGIALAQGEYIARMDSDDIALPDRLEKQVSLLDLRPEIGMCGTQLKVMHTDVWFSHPLEPEPIRCKLLFNCCLNHPTVMFRRALMLELGLWYDAFALHAEDYELWVRMSRVTKLANIDEPLLLYRIHPDQVTSKHAAANRETADRVLYQQLLAFGLEPTVEQFRIHCSLSAHTWAASPQFADSALAWLNVLQEHNRATLYYEVQPFEEMLEQYRNEVVQLCSALKKESALRAASGSRPLSGTRRKRRGGVQRRQGRKRTQLGRSRRRGNRSGRARRRRPAANKRTGK
jgi:glycosyltransferase involved in cell wall biosynthesis